MAAPAKKRKPGRRPAAASRTSEPAAIYELQGVPQRVHRVVTVLGNKLVAEVCGVSPSQPSKWRSGKEHISQDAMHTLIQLDMIVSRLLNLMVPSEVMNWMLGSNPFFNFARPIDILRLRGPMALLPAVEGEEGEGYA